MKKLLLFFVLVPLLAFAQEGRFEKSIRIKVAAMQNFVHMGDKGEEAFWQTKGKITFGIVKYTDEQNPKFKELFINQYRELLPLYNKMNLTSDEKDAHLYIAVLIRQEEDYRKMLTPEQLELYEDTLTQIEFKDEKKTESYNSLFFTDSLLSEYKVRFKIGTN